MLSKEDKARDARLRRLYGIDLTEYDRRLQQQEGNCAICKRPPVNNRLAVDHDHRYKYVKIFPERRDPQTWQATAIYCGLYVIMYGRTRNLAIRHVRLALKGMSVRGLLCFPCNSGLRKYSDDPVRFLNAAEYLKRHQNKE